MRHFVIVSHAVPVDGRWMLDDLAGGAGRVDVVCLFPGGLEVVQHPAGVPSGTRLGRPFTRHHATSRGGLGRYALSRRLERMGGAMDVHADGALVHRIRFPTEPPRGSQPN